MTKDTPRPVLRYASSFVLMTLSVTIGQAADMNRVLARFPAAEALERRASFHARLGFAAAAGDALIPPDLEKYKPAHGSERRAASEPLRQPRLHRTPDKRAFRC